MKRAKKLANTGYNASSVLVVLTLLGAGSVLMALRRAVK